MFCRSAAACSRKRFYSPDRRVEGQDHLEGSKRQDMYSAHIGTWNLVEISRVIVCDPETANPLHFEIVKGVKYSS